MPEGLTQTKTLPSRKTGRLQVGMPAGFISESWPASNRNGGRLQIGIPGRNKSESAKRPNATCTPASVSPRFGPVLLFQVVNEEAALEYPQVEIQCLGTLEQFGCSAADRV